MATSFTYPGVYIQEFAPGAPIAGVGTSTPAFIGPAASGEWNVPTKLTSFDQFVAQYGDQPVPGFYLWYAVRGFFENGGQVCYVVRASNTSYATLPLFDSANVPNPLINVRARQLGIPNPAVSIDVVQTSLLPITPLYQPTGGFALTATNEITMAPPNGQALAAQFRPGDSVHVGPYGEHIIQRISGDIVHFGEDLKLGPLEPLTLRLSNAPAGAKVFRIGPGSLPAGTLVPGTMLTFTQGASDTQIVASVQTEYLQTAPASSISYRVTLRIGLGIGIDNTLPAAVQSQEFDLKVYLGNAINSYPYPFLSVDPAHPRYYPNIINNDPAGQILVIPVEPVPSSIGTSSLPANLVKTQLVPPLLGEDPMQLTADNYTASINTLQTIDDVNLLSLPDAIAHLTPAGTLAVQQYAITHCEQMGDRFAVLDAQPSLPLFGAGSIVEQRQGLDSSRGYAALYFPWLRIVPVGPGAPILVPPSGHVCGLIARVDDSRGVHKAPANEIVNGAVGLELTMSDVDQGQINILGINAIRQFQGGRPTLWGARTTATDTNWQYVNIRRLFLFLEESIQEGIRWAVFEPNNMALWAKLKRSITEFLTRVWRDGALFGETPDKAFYVRIDESLNTDTTRALGQLFIQIGVRPSYPAEFIIVRIGIWQGGSSLTEGQ